MWNWLTREFSPHAAIQSLLFAMLLPALAVAAEPAGPPAERLPGTAVFAAEWQGLGEKCGGMFDLAEAILHAPLIAKEMGAEAVEFQALGELLRAGLTHPGALAVTPKPAGGPPVVDAVIAAGDASTALAAKLSDFATRSGVEVEQRADGAATVYGIARPPLHWIAADGCLLISTHAASLAALRTSGGAGRLTESPDYVAARAALPVNADGWRFAGHVNLGEILKLAAEDDPQAAKVMGWLGLGDFKSLCFVVDEDAYGVRMRGSVGIPQGSGILAKLYRPSMLSDADLGLIPRDAIWGQVANTDLAAAWEQFRGTLEESDPDLLTQIDGGLAAARQTLGFSPTDDLLPALGDTWALYDADSHGGLFLTGLVLVGDAARPQDIEGILARVVQIVTPLAAQGDVRITQKTYEHGGRSVQYLLVGGFPVPVAPAWGFADGRFVFGLHPQTVALALDQADTKTRTSSILDHPDLKTARALLPAQMSGFSFVDSARGAAAWNALKLLACSAVASLSVGGREFDLGRVPPFAAPDNGVKASFTGVTYDAQGVHWITLGAAPESAMAGADMSSVAVIALLVSILLPSLARARELAKRAVSAGNLRSIAMSCHMWASDHDGKFPDDLDALVRAGMIHADVLRSPLDPEVGRVSYVLIGGQVVQKVVPQNLLANVLAYELVFDDEGTNVAFVDGHVDHLDPAELEQALRRTYERLGREYEAPRKGW